MLLKSVVLDVDGWCEDVSMWYVETAYHSLVVIPDGERGGEGARGAVGCVQIGICRAFTYEKEDGDYKPDMFTTGGVLELPELCALNVALLEVGQDLFFERAGWWLWRQAARHFNLIEPDALRARRGAALLARRPQSVWTDNNAVLGCDGKPLTNYGIGAPLYARGSWQSMACGFWVHDNRALCGPTVKR